MGPSETPEGASRPKASARTRRLALTLAILGFAVVVLLAGSGVSQINDPDDPRNRQCGELAGCNAAQDCWMHHRGEGMRDAFVVVPIVPEQLKVGEMQTVPLQVISPWKNHVGGVSIQVHVESAEEGQSPLVRVQGAAAGGGDNSEAFTFEGSYAVDPAELDETPPRVHNFTVDPGVTSIVSTVNFKFNDAGGGLPDPIESPTQSSIEARMLWPGANFGREYEPTDSRATFRNLTMAGQDLVQGGPGNWSVNFEWDAANAGSSVDYEVHVVVGYGTGGGEESAVYEVTTIDPTLIINPGTSEVYEVPLVGLGKGTAKVTFEVRAYTEYRLRHQDGVTPDYDNYTRFAAEEIVVGDTFVPSSTGLVEVEAAGEDFRLVAGEVTGFATAILLLPSLLLGGTFGKGSRKFFNTLLGGAKRRVMYHSLISLGITLAAIVHIVMFMLEIRYTIMMGLLWGGLGTLALLVLGLTGYYQIPLIQRHGYKWWRYTHLVFGILVIVFATWHAVIDGPDFNFIREGLPQWLNDINLAEK